MNIEESSLWDSVGRVINSPSKPIHRYWELSIHADGKVISPIKLLNIDRLRDFENNISAVIMVDVELLLGDFTYDVFPFQDGLEITLYGNPLLEAGAIPDENQSMTVERFIAYLVSKDNPILNNSRRNPPTREVLNTTGTITATFQLVSKAVEQMRMRLYGNNFRDCTMEEVLRLVMSNESKKISVDKQFLPKGVDIVPLADTSKVRQICIKQGVPLADVPNYLHLLQGGIYSSGLGYFYEKDYWYIYPCFDTTRFQKSERTLTVICVPANKLPQVERTYLENGNSLTIIATGDIRHVDDSTKLQLNAGNGVMFADASKMADEMGVASDNKLIAARAKVANDFIAVPRDDGNNYVPVAKNVVTANPLIEFSKLAKREGGLFTLVWDNSFAELVYPGMSTKIIYLEEDDVKEMYGVLNKVHEYTELVGQGMTTNRHMTRSMVSIFTHRV